MHECMPPKRQAQQGKVKLSQAAGTPLNAARAEQRPAHSSARRQQLPAATRLAPLCHDFSLQHTMQQPSSSYSNYNCSSAQMQLGPTWRPSAMKPSMFQVPR